MKDPISPVRPTRPGSDKIILYSVFSGGFVYTECMKFTLGMVSAFVLVMVWKKWSRPYLVWQFSRGDL